MKTRKITRLLMALIFLPMLITYPARAEIFKSNVLSFGYEDSCEDFARALSQASNEYIFFSFDKRCQPHTHARTYGVISRVFSDVLTLGMSEFMGDTNPNDHSFTTYDLKIKLNKPDGSVETAVSTPVSFKNLQSCEPVRDALSTFRFSKDRIVIPTCSSDGVLTITVTH